MKNITKFNGISYLTDFKSYYTGKNIMLVTGKNSYELSGAKAICDGVLESENVIQFNEFSVNPKLSDAVVGARLAREHAVECIIAVGGGSVLDTAKLIKAFYSSDGNELNIAVGKDKVIDPGIPVIAIPTTAGSGSEATHFAVVYVEEDKYSLAAKCLKPDGVILDGSLVTSGDSYLKVCNAFDAMAQAIESYWAKGANDESRVYASNAIALGWEVLPKYIMDKCTDLDAQKMIEAANMAGKAIDISKTTAAHAWSYAFTSNFNIPHGHAVWLTLPSIFELHYAHSKERDDGFHEIMNELIQILGLNVMESLSDQLKAVMLRTGVADSAEQLGITRSARLVLSQKVNIQRLENNPIQLTEQDISHIFSI